MNMVGGFKNALVSLGTKPVKDNKGVVGFELITKVSSNTSVRIQKLAYGKVELETNSELDKLFPDGHGTLFKIFNLKAKVPRRKEDYSIFYTKLGHLYQRYLEGVTRDGHSVKVNITVYLKDLDGKIVHQELIKSVKPEPSQNYKTVPKNSKLLQGKSWEAEVTHWFSPSTGEVEDRGLDLTNKNHPYYYQSISADLIYLDKVISNVPLADLLKYTTESLQRLSREHALKLQIEFRRGFKTSNHKNSLKETDSLMEFREKLADFLKDSKLIDPSDKYSGIESKMHEEYKNRLESVNIDYRHEATIGGSQLRMDFSVKDPKINKFICTEMKAAKATAQDVNQLVGYIRYNASTDCSQEHGKLIAPSFSEDAETFAKLVEAKDQIKITLEYWK